MRRVTGSPSMALLNHYKDVGQWVPHVSQHLPEASLQRCMGEGLRQKAARTAMGRKIFGPLTFTVRFKQETGTTDLFTPLPCSGFRKGYPGLPAYLPLEVLWVLRPCVSRAWQCLGDGTEPDSLPPVPRVTLRVNTQLPCQLFPATP